MGKRGRKVRQEGTEPLESMDDDAAAMTRELEDDDVRRALLGAAESQNSKAKKKKKGRRKSGGDEDDANAGRGGKGAGSNKSNNRKSGRNAAAGGDSDDEDLENIDAFLSDSDEAEPAGEDGEDGYEVVDYGEQGDEDGMDAGLDHHASALHQGLLSAPLEEVIVAAPMYEEILSSARAAVMTRRAHVLAGSMLKGLMKRLVGEAAADNDVDVQDDGEDGGASFQGFDGGDEIDSDSEELVDVFDGLRVWRPMSHEFTKERTGESLWRLASTSTTIDYRIEADELVAAPAGGRLVGPIHLRFLAELYVERDLAGGPHRESFVLSWQALEEAVRPPPTPERRARKGAHSPSSTPPSRGRGFDDSSDDDDGSGSSDSGSEADDDGGGSSSGSDDSDEPLDEGAEGEEQDDGVDDDDYDDPTMFNPIPVLQGTRSSQPRDPRLKFKVEFDRDGIVRLARELCSSVSSAAHICATALVISRVGSGDWCDDDVSSLLRCGDASDFTALADATLEAVDLSAGMSEEGLNAMESPRSIPTRRPTTPAGRARDASRELAAEGAKKPGSGARQGQKRKRGGGSDSQSSSPPKSSKKFRWGKNQSKSYVLCPRERKVMHGV